MKWLNRGKLRTSDGIGLAAVERLVRDDVGKICLIDVQRNRTEDAAASVKTLGAETHTLAIDFHDAKDLGREVDTLLADPSSVNILVIAADSATWGR